LCLDDPAKKQGEQGGGEEWIKFHNGG
jgi:hypothetical protein